VKLERIGGMAERTPNNGTGGFEILHKSFYLFLSFSLLAVQSGCYTTRAVKSLSSQEILKAQGNDFFFRNDLLVKVFYFDGQVSRQVTGKIKSVTNSLIILTTLQKMDVPIPSSRIEKINVYDKKLDIVTTVMGGALVSFVLFVVIGTLITKDQIGNLK